VTATRVQVVANVTATAAMLGETRTQVMFDRTATADTIAMDRTSTVEARDATRTFVAQYKPIAVGELVSYADRHIGEDVVIRGRVFNIIDGQTFQMFIGGSNAVYVQLSEPMTGIYEDDQVTVYGTVLGYVEGTNAFGGTVKQPHLTLAVVTKP
jgi:hypothetical protein